ncbi:MAG: hypothetical protein N3F03_01005, partial [Ignavibacteria bacterium]|nr:hypothetical protein [Ignavibacteria bacterium]
YNFRMNWLIASLMSIFNNKSKAVGVYYTETNSYIIVYKSRTEDTFKLGQSIGKKITSEDFKSS